MSAATDSLKNYLLVFLKSGVYNLFLLIWHRFTVIKIVNIFYIEFTSIDRYLSIIK